MEEKEIKAIIENLQEEPSGEKKSKSLIKKFGFAGFMFFFIKGMGWVVVAIIAWIWGPESIDVIKEFFVNLF